ncbi:MAG: efflux RND transporter periplasmic adaptor subunit [Victivallaceae bacterium]|nr:efflux RND transporter periplasmic adaptor subunit [Victivallaceae bacterium]
MKKFSLFILANLLCLLAYASPVVTPILLRQRSVKVIIFPLQRAVVASMVDTVVIKYNVKEGEVFNQNEPICLLDERRYQQFFNKSKAVVDETIIECKYSEDRFKRNQELYKKGIIGEDELEKSRLDRSISQTKKKNAIADMTMAKLNLDSCRIIAPFTGRLVRQIVRDHEFVRAGQPILSIINDTQLLAVMHLPSRLKNSVALGQQFKVKIDETGQLYSGLIYEIAGDIDPGSRTFSIKLLIDNRQRLLAAGMSGVLIDMPQKLKNAIKE